MWVWGWDEPTGSAVQQMGLMGHACVTPRFTAQSVQEGAKALADPSGR